MIRENKTWDELEIGDEAVIERPCTPDDFYVFAHASGNLNPMHLPEEDGDGDGAPEALAPSMWVGALVSAVLGNVLPGPGTLYRAQSLRFLGRAEAGDTLSIGVRVAQKGPDRGVTLDCWVDRASGERILEGVAEVTAPERRLSFDDADVPGLVVETHKHFDRLLEIAEPLEPMRTAVVAPEEASALGGAVLAAQHTLITPLLVGDRAKIEAAANEIGADISGFELIEASNHDAAAALGVQLVNEGRADALMKGHLHTDELLHYVIKKDTGLRTMRRLSHVFVMDCPTLDHLLLLSDAAINIAPDLAVKIDIVQNAIDLARALGVETPKVGVLSAVETVTPRIPSTLDAAVLSKMSERGQIEGGIVDGPLAMDNAIDLRAAQTKGLTSAVAGRAQVLIAPNLEAGNMMAKELTFIAHAQAAGVVLGARVPVVLTSRADDDRSRLASCAVAALYQKWKSAN
ncbi:MAG: bifunctional enoyl-CoA hydratase/phosphate acetyltransferase [Pseudomonadota bacterium]